MRSIAVILLTCFISHLAYPTVPRAQEERTESQESEEDGYLKLQTQHQGLRVTIDGKVVGSTPLGPVRLPAGLHKVKVQNPYRTNWLDQQWLANVEIAASDTLIVPVYFKKSVSINSIPFGASVYFKDELIGETPLYFLLGEKEVGLLFLKKSGYQDTSFVIGATPQRYFSIPLTPEQLSLEIATSSAAVDLDQKPRSRLLLYSVLGLAIASGSLALYFREQGNSNYDRYLQTGDPELMNQYFDKAQKFDRFALGSFVVFQVSFLFGFYKLIKRANR